MKEEEHKRMAEDLKTYITEDTELFDSLPFGMAILRGDRGFRIEMVNAEFFRSVGYTMEELLEGDRDFYRFCYEEDRNLLSEMQKESLQSRVSVKNELRFYDRNGEIRWLLLCIRFHEYRDEIPYFLAASWDINDRKKMEDEIRLQTERYKLMEEAANELPLDYDVEKDCLKINDAMKKMYRISQDETRAEEVQKVLHEEDQEKFREVLKAAKEQELEGVFEYRVAIGSQDSIQRYIWHRARYKSVLGNSGKVIRIIGRIYNIDKEKRIHSQLEEKARRDPMTKLLNKQALREEIEEFFSEKPEGIHAFMVIDIDNFKKINDTFGHFFGDAIIKEIADKIMERFRGMDIIGRVGGDEFVVCMKYTTVEHAKAKAASLCESVQKKYIGNRAERTVTCSVGISFFGEDGMDYETLFRKADMAMYQAKVKGKNGYQVADKKIVLREVQTVGEKEERDENYQIVEGQDQDFLTFTFELLSKAKDIDGSINVLLERIGKRYRLNMVCIHEYKKTENELVITNCWASSPMYLQKDLSELRLEIWKDHIRDGKVMISNCNDSSLPEEDRQVFQEIRAKSYAGYSYGERGKPKGYITFCDCEEYRKWTDFEEKTFSEIVRMISVFVTLRSQREEDQHEIQCLQNHDSLTGLYNVNTFKKKAERILRISEPGDIYAFICADVSGFSYINENFGYSEGDQVLKRVAEYIKDIPGVMLACRRYADLFLMMAKVENRDRCVEETIVQNSQFRQFMKKKYPNGNLYESIGIYFWDAESYDIEEFIENANLARKVAKKDQEFWLKVYSDAMKEEKNRERIIAASFYPALNNEEFEVYLQPKFYLDEWKVYGAEALARWRRLDGCYHNPNDFIPVLEKLGYINDLDFYIFEEAVRCLKKWNDDGKEPLILSTNFSGQHFKDLSVNFVDKVCEITGHYGVPNSQLEIEITESVAVQELDKLQEILDRLRKKGFRIAIDDFGTGYSSLNILFDIPVDVVKIDKSFLNTENFQKRKQLIMHIGEMVRLAEEEIIFEGVEEQQQVDFLLECGYRHGQGYIFDKPIRVLDFEQKYLY